MIVVIFDELELLFWITYNTFLKYAIREQVHIMYCYFSEHPTCECNPGWTGQDCSHETMPSTFEPQSYVKYALSFEPNRFITEIQLRFRTREEHGELFRVSDQHNREYGILEIQDSRLRFRYNLNSLRTEEREIWLSAIWVDDGQWHTAKVQR